MGGLLWGWIRGRRSFSLLICTGSLQILASDLLRCALESISRIVWDELGLTMLAGDDASIVV